MPPTQNVVVVDGMTFRVWASRRPGAFARPSYVLVHGIGSSHRYLSRLHAELAATADVYSIDIPGFGGLPKPSFSPDIATIAAGIATVLDRIGVSGAIVLGHSMGAEWVVELGVLRPDLASALVVIGPVVDDRHRTLAAQSTALALDIAGETPAVNAVQLADYLRCGPVWFLRQTRHMLAYAIEERVGLLEAPLLILRGGNDPIAGTDWCRRLRDRARAGRLVIVPGHRHVVQFTAPRAVASAVRAFVGSLVP